MLQSPIPQMLRGRIQEYLIFVFKELLKPSVEAAGTGCPKNKILQSMHWVGF